MVFTYRRDGDPSALVPLVSAYPEDIAQRAKSKQDKETEGLHRIPWLCPLVPAYSKGIQTSGLSRQVLWSSRVICQRKLVGEYQRTKELWNPGPSFSIRHVWAREVSGMTE